MTLEDMAIEMGVLKQDAQFREIKIQRQAAEIVRLKKELAHVIMSLTTEQMRRLDHVPREEDGSR